MGVHALGATWTQQGPKLVGTGASATPTRAQAWRCRPTGTPRSSAAPATTATRGAAWVFTRSGRTWTQQGPKLVGTGAAGGSARQGSSVALSGDGTPRSSAAPATTASRGRCGCSRARGRPGPSKAKARRHRRRRRADSATAWRCRPTATPRLSAAPATRAAGAAWVFTRSGTTWTQQGPKLVGTGAAGHADQGHSVALSADGNTALVGGDGDDSYGGAAWVFTRSGTTWTQQGPKLVGTGAVGDADQGYSVALSADGNTALVGGAATTAGKSGAAWVFTRSGTTWTQQGESSSAPARSAAPTGLQRGAVGRREHRARRRPGRQRDVGAALVFVTQLPPGTKITKAKISSKHHQATFSFKAIGMATGFQCALSETEGARQEAQAVRSQPAARRKPRGNRPPANTPSRCARPTPPAAEPTPPKKSFTIT